MTKKLKSFFGLRRTAPKDRDFHFVSLRERTTFTQTDYVIRANSEANARQIFKTFLQASRRDELYHHPCVTVTEHSYHRARVYSIKNNFMPEHQADQLIRNYHYHTHFEPPIYTGPTLLQRAALLMRGFYSRLKTNLPYASIDRRTSGPTGR